MSRQTKREWFEALIQGFENSRFTGEVLPHLHFNNGELTKIRLLVENKTKS